MSKLPKSFNQKTSHPSRVPLVGAGTGVMVICLLLAFGYQSLRKPKVAIERKVETSGTLNEKRLPAVVALLDSRTTLGLSEGQVKELQLLQDKQIKALVPIEAQLNEIVSPLNRMSESGATMPMNPQDIQVIAKQISGPSKRKREIETGFSKQAWRTLTHEQQEKALKLSLSHRPFMAEKGRAEDSE